ncbi:1-pyrroline-5-carboxylate dehydrogenase [Cyphellophora europaea CBS 101466]|uniref:Multifunctional fusion protein n=1 Tax=Cyphellophora europaea (strain CBS 101466) TaxID=1220924 RepID=W2RTI1_CYPE1|nr:1-pyrroline-5-carboxylate dehydrogenase [Cyphellophora europaea CBS 101466]ETN39048.1 1-pyrroline-5-carboxylate dehydrogenase [Cyphellophora europaea CBS 101466]
MPSIRPCHLSQRPFNPRAYQRIESSLRRSLATAGTHRTPKPFNEQNLHYAKSSPERKQLEEALSRLRSQIPVAVPSIAFHGGGKLSQSMPADHGTVLANYETATEQDVSTAIESALKAKQEWTSMSFFDRAAIFLRAAELVSGKYRFEIMAATMLGQGKNAWQAEIDAAAELADFFRFNVSFAQEIYDRQPTINAPGHAGRTDWRPLEGFVYAVSPFNFTAIGGNLVSGPALLGNVVIWKPSPASILSSHLVYKILLEAGLPPNVVQMVNGDAEMITKAVFDHPEFAALNFTGSSDVFRSLYYKAAEGVVTKKYKEFPRFVAETSGKNFHLVHSSADISNAVKHTMRASFEYSGQKCSACSRIYLPASRSEEFLDELKTHLKTIKMGDPEDFGNFLGPVINKPAFDRVTKVIESANKDSQLDKVAGGGYDDSKGYYIEPTVYIAKTLEHDLFNKELFGPVLVAYVYEDAEYDSLLAKIDKQGGGFALTGAIFANDPVAINKAEDKLRYAAGNFYTNCKTTGAVIGQQSFGGARSSGTNDKAGSADSLRRFVSPRTLKEEFNRLDTVLYPSNL